MENTIKNKLTGSWKLVSYETEEQDGTIHHPFGENPSGIIIYSTDGNVSVQLMRSGRYQYVNSELYDDLGVRYGDLPYIAYAGPFIVDEDRPAVTHFVEVALDPEWIGQQQFRLIELKNDLLRLSSDGPFGANKILFRLLWKKNDKP